MKIKQKPTKKAKYNIWSRRFRGNASIVLPCGYTRHFINDDYYSAAKEAISRSTFKHMLDMREFLARLPNGFEQDGRVVNIARDELPNNLFIPNADGDIIDS